MKNINNANDVQKVLRQIKLDFDVLINLCVNIGENETMPGVTSHKLDIINGRKAFNDKVESWLLAVKNVAPEVGCVGDSDDTCGVSARQVYVKNVAPVVDYVGNGTDTCGLSGRMNVVPVVGCGRDGVGKSKVSSSAGTSHTSCSSRLRKSRVKVQLARLALCHKKERQQEVTPEERQL